jgi:hypothetical protein
MWQKVLVVVVIVIIGLAALPFALTGLSRLTNSAHHTASTFASNPPIVGGSDSSSATQTATALFGQATMTAGHSGQTSTSNGGYVWGSGGSEATVNGKPRHASGKCPTCIVSFVAGEAVYGYTVMDANKVVKCDGGGCFYPNIPFDGQVVDGVVNPTTSEVPPNVQVHN